MKLFIHAFSDLPALHSYLARDDVQAPVRGAKSILVQIYNKDEDEHWVSQIVDAFCMLRKDVVIVGATAFGNIAEGKVSDARTVVSLSCFDTASLVLIEEDCQAGEEADAAHRFLAALRNRTTDTRGILFLSTPLSFNCDLLLSFIHASSPGLPIFGGGSADISLQQMLVFSQDRMIRSGLVAVALCGGTLELMRSVHLGWLPIGRKMVVTKAQGPVVATIDNKPAIEIYKRYLGITSDEHFFLNVMEFPLLVEKRGELHARVPYEAGDDGSIRFTAELREGEEVHFGYARVASIQEQVQALEMSVQEFEPEAIHIYSCIIRHFVLQRDIDLELSPFQAIAPTAGFFTAGEFCGRPDSNVLRNAAMVVVAMREAPASGKTMPFCLTAQKPVTSNLYEDNHMRILLRYQNFMHAITEDLEIANKELARLAECDALTGLFNRRRLVNVMQHELERSSRYGKLFSVIICDVDHFKRLNDLHGHQAGDVVLKELAHALQKEARASDVVCRFGGEEFVILMPETSADKAADSAERIRRSIGTLALMHGDVALPPITLSFGVAGFPGNGRTPDELISAADAALYDAKHLGRNRVCLSARESGEKT